MGGKFCSPECHLIVLSTTYCRRIDRYRILARAMRPRTSVLYFDVDLKGRISMCRTGRFTRRSCPLRLDIIIFQTWSLSVPQSYTLLELIAIHPCVTLRTVGRFGSSESVTTKKSWVSSVTNVSNWHFERTTIIHIQKIT